MNIDDPARFASDFRVRSPARSAKVFRHKKRRIVQNDAAKTKVSPVDIPTGWDPRTKQQPTGLIAYPACGRAVLFESLQVPKPAFDLCAHKRKAAALKLRCC